MLKGAGHTKNKARVQPCGGKHYTYRVSPPKYIVTLTPDGLNLKMKDILINTAFIIIQSFLNTLFVDSLSNELSFQMYQEKRVYNAKVRI